MRGQRKRGVLIEPYSKNMVKTEIRFDKASGGSFFAAHALEEIEAPTLRELRTKLDKIALSYQPLKWSKVIIVEVSWADEERHHNSIGVPGHERRIRRELELSYHVHERAKIPGEKDFCYGRPIIEPSDRQSTQWREENSFYGVDRVHVDTEAVVIPYSDQALKNIEAIRDGIDALADRLRDLLSPKKAAAFLAGVVDPSRLLGEGKKER